jgi:hypothetical protein
VAIICNVVVAACAIVPQRPSKLTQLAQDLNANTEGQRGIMNEYIIVQGQLQSTAGESGGHLAPYVPIRVCNVGTGADAMSFAE